MSESDPWARDAATWLGAHAQRRSPERALRWGEGSDNVAVFRNLSFEQERDHIDAARSWQQRKSDAGYGSISWPVAYGGAGLSPEHERTFDRLESGFATPPGHEAISITLDLVGPTLLTCGTEEQKERYLPDLRRTNAMWCQLFSEPGAGSDLASLQCRASRDGNEWVIDGQKVWTSGARFADFGYLLARTSTEESRHGGLTAFVVRMDAPGLDVRPLRQMSGGSSFNEVFFTGVRVGDEDRLGPVGQGWQVAVTTLGFERAAATKSGASGGDVFDRLVLAARHAGRANDPVARQRLAAVYISGRVRTMTRRRGAEALKAGGVPGPEGSVGKLAFTEGLAEIADVAGLIVGPSMTANTGEWGTFAWSELVNGVPGFRIAGGTDEVQRNIIAERVLGLPR